MLANMPLTFDPVDALLRGLNSRITAERARAEEELAEILANTPERNPGMDLPPVQGVVRYDSTVHTIADVARMTPYLQERVARAHRNNYSPNGRIVITQTAPFPGDGPAERRALIAALHGLSLVPKESQL